MLTVVRMRARWQDFVDHNNSKLAGLTPAEVSPTRLPHVHYLPSVRSYEASQLQPGLCAVLMRRMVLPGGGGSHVHVVIVPEVQ